MSVTGRRSASGGGGGGVKDCGGMDRKLLRLIGKALALRGNTVGVYACVSDDGDNVGSTNEAAAIGCGSTGAAASSGKGRDSSSGKGRADSFVCVNMT
jgi:hypothetical protein